MMKLQKSISLLAAAGLLLTTTACRSQQAVTEAAPAVTDTASPAAYCKKVSANAQTVRTLTARIRIDLNVDGTDLSGNGTLRMKRDDVVQLSVTFLGMEVGRLEFSPDGVLVIDRLHKQYVRAAYGQVDFLRNAGLDFYAVQALFWNELFLPGEKTVTDRGLARFRTSAAGDHTLLWLTDAPKLNYRFLTVTSTGSIDRLTVDSKREGESGELTWRYADFTAFNGKPFPTKMSVAASGAGRQGGFTLSLGKLGCGDDWNAHTQPPAKYKERDANVLFRQLMGM